MSDQASDIARSVADAGAQYAEQRWMQDEAQDIRILWRGRVYDAIFAGILHALDLYERTAQRRRKRRKFVLAWCLTCRAQLRVPRSTGCHKVSCPTCGNVQATRGPAPEAGVDRALDVPQPQLKEISHA